MSADAATLLGGLLVLGGVFVSVVTLLGVALAVASAFDRTGT